MLLQSFSMFYSPTEPFIMGMFQTFSADAVGTFTSYSGQVKSTLHLLQSHPSLTLNT